MIGPSAALRAAAALPVAALVAAVAASVAVADPPTRTHDYLAQTQASLRPDDRSGVRGPSAATTASRPAARPDNRGGIRGPGSPSRLLHPVQATSASFNWGDAATGSAVTLGAVAVLGAAALAVRRPTVPRERSL